MTKQISNIFKVENGTKRPLITMTGYIGGWRVNSESLFAAIKKMEEEGVTDCDILINSGGGSTIEGLTIGEYLEKSSIKFHGIVSGMAASMAGVILQFCDTRTSYKYGRIMTHKVSGGVHGESDQIRAYADLVDQEEEHIVGKFIERTGKDAATVATWMKSGVMTWFNAAKAKTNNLIDAIIDNGKSAPELPKDATEEDIIQTYGLTFNSIIEDYKPPIKNQNPENNTMKTRILTMLGMAALANGLTENSTDEAVFAELQNIIDSARNETKAVAELKAFREGQAKALVAAMAKAGKITAAEIPQWEKDATENYTLVSAASERMTGKIDPAAGLDPKPSDPSSDGQPAMLKGREDWDFDKWMTEAPKDFDKLEANHPEEFEKIFNAKFNPEA